MCRLTGRIADIERASTHDGNGIRTVVFFKGCPLSCAWCHNPECISFEKEKLFYPEKCIGCGKCAEGCFTGAKVTCGRDMTADDLLAEILQDRDYYSDGGGVTFSGGEPLAQRPFLHEIVDACRAENIGCAVETSLLYYDESLFRKLDFVMADLKIWNSELHKTYTGVPNEPIIEHFRALDKLHIPLIVRTPVIPEIDQEIDKIAAFVKTLSNVVRYELLPYHPLGLEKAKALGSEQRRFTVPSKELMEELRTLC